MRFLCMVMVAALPLGAECIPISANTFAARDLAGAVPLFRALAPEAVLGFVPTPGVQRILTSRDLLLIARRQGLDSEYVLPSICIERATRPIDVDQLKSTLQTAAAVAGARLEILDFSKQPVPEGCLEFSLSGLSRPPEDAPAAPVIWRGRLVYDDRSSLSIWARVRLTIERPALVAVSKIAAGETVRGAGDVVLRMVEEFPFSERALDSVAEAVGKTARRTILAGQRIEASMLLASADVARGETVRVEVIDGLAVLWFDARAESSGQKGEQVTLRNPSSGRAFRGTVEEKGKVVVRPGDQL